MLKSLKKNEIILNKREIIIINSFGILHNFFRYAKSVFVGKSTIFNRLTESRQAITDEVSGVTRYRHYGKVEWNGCEFSVIDTGGYVQGSVDIFETEIRKQVELAIDEANVIYFHHLNCFI